MATTMHEKTGSLAETVNRLYWSSGETVDRIVDELGIGRSTLYAALRPVSAGMSCPQCGERMIFSNRTSRDHGTASCRACGMRSQQQEGAAGASAAAEEAHAGGEEPRHDSMGAWSRWREELAAVAPERAAMVGGAAALGMMIGAAATRAVRHRL